MNNIERKIMDLILDLYPNSNGKISEISIISEDYYLLNILTNLQQFIL